MRFSTSGTIVVLGCLFAFGCSGPASSGDAANDAASQDVAGDTSSGADSPVDAPTGDTPSTDGSTADAAACAPSDAGTLQTNYYCDLASIHVIARDGMPTEVRAYGRVGLSGTSDCAVVDSVDLVRGSTVVQHIEGGVTFVPGDQSAHLATAPADAAWTTECGNETTRLTAYGMIVRGRDAMGPFEARCGTAESGGRWPPGTYLACHRNVENPPLTGTPSTASVMTFSGLSATSLNVAIPHSGSTPVFASIDATVRVVSPEYAPFGSGPPLSSMDTTGWMGLASEMPVPPQTFTELSLDNSSTPQPFPPELCPPPSTDPMTPPPPFFLTRIRGSSAMGATTVEALTSCTTIPTH